MPAVTESKNLIVATGHLHLHATLPVSPAVAASYTTLDLGEADYTFKSGGDIKEAWLAIGGSLGKAASTRKLALTDEELNTLDRAANYWERIATASKVHSARIVAAVVDAATGVTANAGGGAAGDAEADGLRLKFAQSVTAQQRADVKAQITTAVKAAEDDLQNIFRANLDSNTPMSAADVAAEARARSIVARLKDFDPASDAELSKQMKEAEERRATMSAASLKADLEAMAKSGRGTSRDVESFDTKTMNSAIAATQKAIAAEASQLEQSAEKYKALADPQRVYTEQLKEIARLQATNKLSAKEAGDAIARVKAEMGHELTNAIDASNDALRGFGDRLSELDNNPFLTDVGRQRARVAILHEENEAIEKQIALLKKFADEHPGVDPAAVRGQVRGLQDRQSRNQGTAGRPDLAGMGIAANLEANLVQSMNRLRTPAQGIADTISGTIGGAFDSVNNNLTGLIMGTQTWQDALNNIEMTIANELVGGIVKMFTAWVEQRAIAGLASIMWSEAEGTADVAAKAPGAALTSISSFGVAAVVGIAALVAAMAAFGGFSKGGYTGDIDTSHVAGVVHGGEWVAPAWMNHDPVYGPQIAGLEAARQGKPGHSFGGFIRDMLVYAGHGPLLPRGTKATLDNYNLIDGKVTRGESLPYKPTTPGWVAAGDGSYVFDYKLAGADYMKSIGYTVPQTTSDMSVRSGVSSVGGSGSSGSLANPGGDKQPLVLVVDHREVANINSILTNPRFRVTVQNIGRDDRGV
jgi:hypothetical protein